MYSTHELIVGLELHTYSSLDRTFLQEYANSLERVDHKVVYADAKNQEIKGKTPLTATEVHQAFLDPQITFATTPEGFANALKENRKGSKKVFLLMSSGNLGGLNYQELVQ
jgi:UDP-N-acetylmuramate: L-alanyl-gamma-D-glutamyl-meso-diaminopimelate ligase